MQINFHPATGHPYTLPAPIRFGMRGLGQTTAPAPSATSIASVAASAAAATGSILAGLSSASVGILSSSFALAGPIGAAIAGLTAIAIAIASQFKGCGQTCIEATDIVNQVEPYLQQNLATYLAAPIHYASLQAAAMNNFNTAWNALTAACSAAALGTAGQNCISNRANGACYYKTSGGVWQPMSGWPYYQWIGFGAAGSGNTCWNWFVGYYDPIANDPTVVPDPTSPSDLSTTPTTVSGTPATTTTAASTSTSSNPITELSDSGMLIPLAIAAGVALLLMSEGG
jgi:hypothetical protein